MKQKRRLVIMIMALFIVLLTSSQLGLAKEWDFRPIDDVNKAWEIKFNIPLDESSLTSASVYILDSKTQKHPTKQQLVGNGDKVQVVPTQPYQVGEQYMLMITGAVRARDGKPLKTSVEVPFRVVNSTDKILAVQQGIDIGFGTTITITASPDVHAVKIGTQAMDFRGNNRYRLTIFNAQSGGTINIYAYDEAGKRIETKTHTLK